MCGCTIKDSTNSTELPTYTLYYYCQRLDQLDQQLSYRPIDASYMSFGRILLVHFLCQEVVSKQYSEITKARSTFHHSSSSLSTIRSATLKREIRVRRGIEASTVRYSSQCFFYLRYMLDDYLLISSFCSVWHLPIIE